jgi:hypothetical protein
MQGVLVGRGVSLGVFMLLVGMLLGLVAAGICWLVGLRSLVWPRG